MSVMALPTFDEFFTNPAIARNYPLFVEYRANVVASQPSNPGHALQWNFISKCMSSLTLKETAKRMRISKYYVMQICKEHGVHAWPYKNFFGRHKQRHRYKS